MPRAIVNVANGNIGDMRHSMLSLAQFQSINGTGWVLADGSSCVGTKYQTITGNANIPDLRGRVLAGKDDMGGVAANRLTAAGSGITGTTLGAVGGVETHTLTGAQSGIPAHAHNLRADGTAVAQLGSISGSNGFAGGGTGFTTNTATQNNTAANASQAHQNTQPTMISNIFIKVN
jgi:microcystin-dependent protein